MHSPIISRSLRAASASMQNSPPVPSPQYLARAFRDSSAVVIPISYYTLLQVPQFAHTTSIQHRIQELCEQPTQAAYSSETLFSRAVLLHSAAECLCDVQSKRGYDRKLEAGLHEVKVPQADVPGALVLLQESGQCDATINLAASWLHHHPDNPEIPDVATCMALALCDRAGVVLDALSGGRQINGRPASLKDACKDLEKALELCEENDIAEGLQEHIKEALEGYGPMYAVDLLSQPVTADDSAAAADRARGMQVLGKVLSQALPADADAAAQVTQKVDDMLVKARAQLSAAEQLSLLPALRSSPALKSPAAAAGVAYDTALAYVAEGYTRYLPHYIHTAAELFKEAGDLAADQVDPTCMERACCAVLLGDMAMSKQLLGLGPGAAPGQGDPEIHAFVKANSQSGGTSAGVKALAKSWLAEAVLPAFNTTTSAAAGVHSMETQASAKQQAAAAMVTATFDGWFTSPAVAVYNQIRKMVKKGPVLAFIHTACTLPGFIAAFLLAMQKQQLAITKATADIVVKAKQATPVRSPAVAVPSGAAAVVQAALRNDRAARALSDTAVLAASDNLVESSSTAPTASPPTPAAAAAASSQFMSSTELTADAIAEAVKPTSLEQAFDAVVVVSGEQPKNVRLRFQKAQAIDDEDAKAVSGSRKGQARKGDVQVAMSDMAASAVDLRKKLDRMEREMWDASAAAAKRPGTPLDSLATHFVKMLGAVAVLSVAAMGIFRTVGMSDAGHGTGTTQTALAACNMATVQTSSSSR